MERSVAWFFQCQDGLPRVGRPQEQTVWLCAPLGSANQDYVLSALFLHDGQTEEGGTGVERVA